MLIAVDSNTSASAIVSQQRETQSTQAERRARQVAKMLHCSMDTFTRLEGESPKDAYFMCVRQDKTLRLKAHLGDAFSLATWQEPYYIGLASSAGYAPPLIPVPSSSAVIASVFDDTQPLDAHALRANAPDVIALAWAVHRHVQASPIRDTSSPDVLCRAKQRLTQALSQSCLSQDVTDLLQQKLDWLTHALEATSSTRVVLNGSMRAGNFVRQHGNLILTDWARARWGDPLEDLVDVSQSLRASMARSLAYLDTYNGYCQTPTTPMQQRRFLLLQAVSNVDAYVRAVDHLGPAHPTTRALQMRIAENEAYFIDIPRLNAAALPAGSVAVAPAIDDLHAGRRAAAQFTKDFLPPDTTLAEPIEQKDAFYFFRASSSSQDWFLKVRQSSSDQSRWLEPHWTAWAADQHLAPEVHPDVGHFEHSNMLATKWSGDKHLDSVTANRAEVRASVLTQMRALHALAAPVGLISSEPNKAPSYTGGAWGRYKELVDRNIQTPIALNVMHDLLVQAEAELLALNVKQTICHGDLLPRNIFFVDGQAHFVDWDWAKWGDPLSDVAKFFALGNMDYTEVEASLGVYFGRAATRQELRHLLLILLITELDYYGANQYDLDADHPGVLRRARRAFQIRDMLYSEEAGHESANQ